MTNNNSHPDKTPEALKIREELQGSQETLRALDELAKEEQPDTTLPPVPEDLREQWKDRYGETIERAPQSAETPASSPFSFWKFASMAALAVFALFFTIRGGGPTPPQEGDNTFDPTVLRDQATFTPTPDTVTLFQASPRISYQDILPTRSAGLILEITSDQDVRQIMIRHDLKKAVFVDANRGMLFPIPGTPDDAIQLVKDPDTADQYDYGEAIDDYLGATE